jgi:hypothetical protein
MVTRSGQGEVDGGSAVGRGGIEAPLAGYFHGAGESTPQGDSARKHDIRLPGAAVLREATLGR